MGREEPPLGPTGSRTQAQEEEDRGCGSMGRVLPSVDDALPGFEPQRSVNWVWLCTPVNLLALEKVEAGRLEVQDRPWLYRQLETSLNHILKIK